MGWLFKDKKPPEVSPEVKAKYVHASTDELKKEAVALREERDNPKLTSKEKSGSFFRGAFISPESLVGQIIGWFAGNYLAYKLKLKSDVAALGTQVAASTVGGAVLGLNAMRRYNNYKCDEHMEKAEVELKFVDKLVTEREQATRSTTPTK